MADTSMDVVASWEDADFSLEPLALEDGEEAYVPPLAGESAPEGANAEIPPPVLVVDVAGVAS